MDRSFTCDCSGTIFTGENCEEEAATNQQDPSQQDDTIAYSIGAVLAVMVVSVVLVLLLFRWQRHTRSMMATDFLEQLEASLGLAAATQQPNASCSWFRLLHRAHWCLGLTRAPSQFVRRKTRS